MAENTAPPNGDSAAASRWLALKDEGNAFFRSGDYLKAAASYTKALKEHSSAGADELAAAAVYSNRSAAFVKLAKLPKALADADACAKLRPEWEKAHFRRGEALEAMGGPQNAAAAVKAYERALELAPESAEIAKRLRAAKAPKLPRERSTGFNFPTASSVPPPPAWSEPALGSLDLGLLGAIARPAGMGGKQVETSPEFVSALVGAAEAANGVGAWLAPYLAKAAKDAPGDEPWVFEAPGVAKALDAGLLRTVTGALTHSAFVLIAAEAGGEDPAAAALREAAVAVGQGCAGLAHNMLNPVLRAWGSRQTHAKLLGAALQLLESPGTPLTLPAGQSVAAGAEMSNFLKLVAQLLGNPEAFGLLTGHAALMRVRLMLLRAHTSAQRAEGEKDKKEWADKAAASARALLLLEQMRAAGKWEGVMEGLCQPETAKQFHAGVAELSTQHEMLAAAFTKFGFQGSVGL